MKKAILLILTVILMTACYSKNQNNRISHSPQYSGEKGKFINDQPTQMTGFKGFLEASTEFFFNKHPNTKPDRDIPVQKLDPATLALNEHSNLSFVRLGHSSLLVQLNGKNWLIDPVFSERASPVQWAGPKRFHEPPLSLDETTGN